ncbi:MAG: Pyrimidine monooxygenase RutA [Actinomycetota bacterium]
MRIGLGLPQLGFHVTGRAVASFVRSSDSIGFSSLWVQEHLFYPLRNTSQYSGKYGTEVHGAYRSFYSPFELLSFAAALSSHMMLGTSVVVAGYHRPVELAQRVATLDQLSEGRVILGVGAGWSTDEHAQMGVDFATRGNRIDEFVPALVRCWDPDPVEFHGAFFTIPAAEVQPKPFNNRRPPLMSGMRSAAGLRRTARHFDMWNPTVGTGIPIADNLAWLREHQPPGVTPMRLITRVYAARPAGGDDGLADGLDRIRAGLDESAALGAEEAIVECGFWSAITSERDWESLPERLAEIVGDYD